MDMSDRLLALAPFHSPALSQHRTSHIGYWTGNHQLNRTNNRSHQWLFSCLLPFQQHKSYMLLLVMKNIDPPHRLYNLMHQCWLTYLLYIH